MNQTVEYIKELTAIASPTGFTREISNYLVKTLEGFGYQPVRTAKGGVNVTIKGQNDEQHRYVTAHVDTLGAIVRAVKPDGRLKLDRIGGFPWNMIEGENCTVHVASTGQKVLGTILIHQTSCHVYKDAGTAERTQDNMEVRLDAKVTNEKETRALGIEVGDFISFDPRTVVTETGFIKSRHLDDKVSAAILLNLLCIYKEEKIELPVTTHFAFSVFEEVGHGANSNIPAQVVEYLAVDMGAMGMTSKQTNIQCLSVSKMLQVLIIMTSVNTWLPWRKSKIFHLSWISIHFMVRMLQQLCPQVQKSNTPFSVLVSSLVILMSALILTR